MNEKAKNLFKNLNYTITANFLVLGISIILNLIVPKFIGITEYSYWQLYVFYSSYVGFFHLGWIDGIYLKLGGEHYEDIDNRNLGTQFLYLFIFQGILGVLLCAYALLFVSDINKMVIFSCTAIVLILMNLKSFIIFVLQSTNRIKEYAKLSVSDRYLYIIVVVGYLLFGGKNYIVLIIFDIVTKAVVTVWGMYIMKDVILSRKYMFKEVSGEIRGNIKIGSNLMLANIASMLILGVSRVFVEQKWDIETFGMLSFALSISNMFMIFISAVSVVLYPLLRRTNQENLSTLYLRVRELFVPFTLFLLLLFNPIRILLEWWLPEYHQSLFYMGVLFPMIVYEGRVSLLVNTYLKTIRQEKLILLSNVITLVLALLTSFISVYLFKNINLVVLSIVFSLAFRCILAESMLSKLFGFDVNKENMIEGILILIFIFGNLFLSNVLSFFVYFFFLIIYITWNYRVMKKSGLYFFSMIKKI